MRRSGGWGGVGVTDKDNSVCQERGRGTGSFLVILLPVNAIECCTLTNIPYVNFLNLKNHIEAIVNTLSSLNISAYLSESHKLVCTNNQYLYNLDLQLSLSQSAISNYVHLFPVFICVLYGNILTINYWHNIKR